LCQLQSELFDFIGTPSPPRRHLSSWLAWLAQKKERFSFFIILSFLAHAALFSFMAIFGPSAGGPKTHSPSQAQDFEAFRHARHEFAESRIDSGKMARILATASDQDVYEAFVKAPKLDDRLSASERDSVYKMMVSEALTSFKERTGNRSALDVPLSEYFKGLREPPSSDASEDFTLVPVGGGSLSYMISRINDILGNDAALNRSRLLDRIESFHKWERRSSHLLGR
jgi:hypothetical protein